jgi:two-component sensor histidine kinase
MYKSADLACLDLSSHLGDLVDDVSRIVPNGITVESVISPALTMRVDKAIPCSMILHELMTNAMRHAYPSGRGTIRLTCAVSECGRQLSLVVSDDGIGMCADPDPALRGALGWTLVRELAAQIDAELTVSAEAGTTVELLVELEAGVNGKEVGHESGHGG